ncbi:11512_t:CDS:1, partial [Entrophospora sp. SA101]
MSSQKHKLQLIAAGKLVPTLHYGSFAANWWIFNNQKMPEGEKQTCVPICLNMRVQLTLFIIRIVSRNNNTRPGYICESDTTGEVYPSASEAINETYKKLFNTKTRYSGPSLIGFDNEAITAELLSGVQFHPFKITIDKLSVLIIDLGDSNDNFDNIVGSGYQSSFMHKYQGNQCLYVQKKIATNNYQIEVFHKEEKIANYNDISPTVVWDKTKILKNFNGNTLFGIDHTITIDAFKKYSVLPICNITGWNDIDIMTQAFEQCLKRSIAVVGVN